MGFYRALIQATPHSMSGGFYSSSWQAAKEEVAGYLTRIKFNSQITSLNISNLIPNTLNLSDPNHPDIPVFGSGANANSVNGINISNYEKLYLNSNCQAMFSSCSDCTDWSGLKLFDWTYVTNCTTMFSNAFNLNSAIELGNSVVACKNMFRNCIKFKQPIVIPESVSDCAFMFSTNQGTSWGTPNNIVPVPDVYFKGKSFRNINIRGMFARMITNSGVLNYNDTRGIRVNVHCNVAIENQLINTTSLNSLTDTGILWLPMSGGNGYYNDLANIYLYNNYEG